MAAIFRFFLVSIFIPLVFCAPNMMKSREVYRSVRFLESSRDIDISSRMDSTKSASNNNNGKNVATKMVRTSASHYMDPYVRRLDSGQLKILYGKPQRGAADVPDIVFPGPKVGDKDRPQILKDDCDKKKTFCEADSNYPYNDIVLALKKSGISLEKYFEVEEIVEKIDINQRFDAPNEVPLCESVQRVAFPLKAQTANGSWNYIVNNVEGKLQGVVVEECNVKNGEQNCMIEGNISNGYKALCRQKFVNKRLVSFSENSNQTVVEAYKFPGCCSCYMVSTPLDAYRSKRSHKFTRARQTKRK